MSDRYALMNLSHIAREALNDLYECIVLDLDDEDARADAAARVEEALEGVAEVFKIVDLSP